MRHLVLAVMLLGCGGTEDEQQMNLVCERSDRSGTYLFQFSERSGNCGPIPEQLGRLDDGPALPDICVFDAPDRWSDSDCTLERAYSCAEDGVAPGATSSTIAITTQQDETGAGLTGLFSITVFASNGQQICRSTYGLVATRQ